MKYIINGKPAYLILRRKGLSKNTLYDRLRAGIPLEQAVRKRLPEKEKYLVYKNNKYICSCGSMASVAKRIKASKGQVCGLFYRNGKKIELFGYTIKRT